MFVVDHKDPDHGAALTGLGLSGLSARGAAAGPLGTAEAQLGITATRTDHGPVATERNVRTGNGRIIGVDDTNAHLITPQ